MFSTARTPMGGNLQRFLRTTLESQGLTEREIEHTFYARLEDPSQLAQATSIEHHAQWEIRTPKSEERLHYGTFRVRRTIKDGETTYMLCIKTMTQADTGRNETELLVTEDIYDQVRKLSGSGMLKTRYTFPIPDSDYVWEIDVFDNNKDEAQPWVKIDLEVKSKDEPLPEFPVTLTDVIGAPSERTEEQNAQVEKLMREVFTTKA